MSIITLKQCTQLEEQIMTAYIDSKLHQLDEVLEGLFQGDMALWPHAPPPTQLRAACLEVLFNLVSLSTSACLTEMNRRKESLRRQAS